MPPGVSADDKRAALAFVANRYAEGGGCVNSKTIELRLGLDPRIGGHVLRRLAEQGYLDLWSSQSGGGRKNVYLLTDKLQNVNGREHPDPARAD